MALAGVDPCRLATAEAVGQVIGASVEPCELSAVDGNGKARFGPLGGFSDVSGRSRAVVQVITASTLDAAGRPGGPEAVWDDAMAMGGHIYGDLGRGSAQVISPSGWVELVRLDDGGLLYVTLAGDGEIGVLDQLTRLLLAGVPAAEIGPA